MFNLHRCQIEKRASHVFTRFTDCAHRSPAGFQRLHNSLLSGKMCKLFVGQWHKEMHAIMDAACKHFSASTSFECPANVGQLFSFESIQKCVCVCVYVSCLHFTNSTPYFLAFTLLMSALPRILGRAGAEWKYSSSGKPAADTRCRPNKRKCWHE